MTVDERAAIFRIKTLQEKRLQHSFRQNDAVNVVKTLGALEILDLLSILRNRNASDFIDRQSSGTQGPHARARIRAANSARVGLKINKNRSKKQ